MTIDLWKAYAHLYPGAVLFVDYTLQDDGAGPYLAAWNLPGDPPTEGEVAAAILAFDAAVAAKRTKQDAKRARQKTDAAGAVGKSVASLKETEKDALFEWLIELAGGLDEDGNVRPIEDWR